MDDAERNLIERIIRENAGALHLLSQNNDALLKEYREGIERRTHINAQGLEVPAKFIEALNELHDEIVRRMNA